MVHRPDEIARRERSFHDQWALKISTDEINVVTAFEGVTSPENRFILAHLDDVRGKRLLDVGCGAGENSVYFALKGAQCVATDISPEMVRTAVTLAGKYGVSVDGKVIDANHLDFPSESFDIVYASNVLHHVDPETALREMHRVVRPGGKVCFWDPLKHNPIINVYRRMASEVRSADERPLDIRLIRFVRRLFSHAEFDTFWIASLWIFLRFYLIEHVHPNKERYWRKIILEEERLRPLYRRLERVDRLLKLLPFMKRFAWNIAVVATK